MKYEARSINKESGFTLIEFVVSFSVFVILISLTTIVFTQTLRTQRVVSDLNIAMNNVAFITEQMAREIRTATEFGDTNGEFGSIQFTNAKGEQVSYKKIGDSIGRCVEGCSVITSPEAKIKNLTFILRLDDGRGDKTAPRITIITSVAGPKGIDVNLQTTISARVIEEED